MADQLLQGRALAFDAFVAGGQHLQRCIHPGGRSGESGEGGHGFSCPRMASASDGSMMRQE
jgi:hypothetical protein